MENLPPTYVEGFHDKLSVFQMKYKDFGATGMKVSAVSFGGGGMSAFYSEFDEDEAISTIREAIRRGVNLIDTAPWYGQGRSETILGKALEGIPRKAYYIATKVGRYELNYEEMFNFTAEKVRASFLDSLKKLNLNYVDIIQVHDIEFAPKLEIILNETLPCLDEFRKSGKTKFIGITGYPLGVLKEAVMKSEIKIDSVLTYTRNTLIDNSLDEYAEFFREKNMGIISAAAHSMGLLTNDGPQPWHPATDQIKEACQKARDYCKAHGVEFGRLATWHALSCDSVQTTLVGMTNKYILESNLSVMINGISEGEHDVLDYIRDEYLQPIRGQHWEGVELKKYWDYMNNQNKAKGSSFI